MTESYDEIAQVPEDAPPSPRVEPQEAPRQEDKAEEAPPKAEEDLPREDKPREAPPQEDKAKKVKAAYIKEPCPGGCGKMLSRHWLRMGKHICPDPAQKKPPPKRR